MSRRRSVYERYGRPLPAELEREIRARWGPGVAADHVAQARLRREGRTGEQEPYKEAPQ